MIEAVPPTPQSSVLDDRPQNKFIFVRIMQTKRWEQRTKFFKAAVAALLTAGNLRKIKVRKAESSVCVELIAAERSAYP